MIRVLSLFLARHKVYYVASGELDATRTMGGPMGEWTEYDSEETRDAARSVARGGYQRRILEGTEAMSGATLKGAARRWGGTYARSRRVLLMRLQGAGFSTTLLGGEKARRILVISRRPA